MINGFENITKPLTVIESAQVKHFVVIFHKCTGKELAVTSTKLIDHWKNQGRKMNGVTIRKIVHYIRERGLVRRLCASDNGYYVEMDDEKLKAYLHSLRQRISSIRKVHDALQIQLNEPEPSQYKLPYKDD